MIITIIIVSWTMFFTANTVFINQEVDYSIETNKEAILEKNNELIIVFKEATLLYEYKYILKTKQKRCYWQKERPAT